MKFIYKLSFLLFFIISLSSCNFQTESRFILGEVDVFPTLEENQEFVRDMLYFPHGEVLREKLKLFAADSMVIKGINFNAEARGQKVKVEFIFSGAAISHSKELTDYFTVFFKEQEELYKSNAYFLEIAERDAETFIKWIINSDYDAIWERASPSLKVLATKEQLIEMLEGSTQAYDLTQNRVLSKRMMQKSLIEQGKVSVGFYYDYEDGTQIDITLEDAIDSTNLLGFRARNFKR